MRTEDMASSRGRGLWAITFSQAVCTDETPKCRPISHLPERAAATRCWRTGCPPWRRRPHLTGILVVLSDPQAAAMAHAAGALVISDTENAGTTAAVAATAACLVDCGHDGMLVVPADIAFRSPWGTSRRSWRRIVTHRAAHRRSRWCLPPWMRQTARMHSRPIPFHCASATRLCARHCEAARARAARRLNRASRASDQDIDRPEDVADFLHRTPRQRTLTRISRLCLIAERDAAHGAVVTYSRKVFIPLTQLCRDVCHYCTFAHRAAQRASEPI